MVKKVLGVGLAAAIMSVGIQSRVEAAPVLNLHICQGVTCVNFGPTGSPLNSGVFTVGDYTIQNVSGTALETSFISQSATNNVTVQRTGTSSATALDVWLSAIGYNMPIGNQLTLDASLGVTRASGNNATSPVSYVAWLSNNVTPLFPPSAVLVSPLLACTAPGTPGSTSCSTDPSPVFGPAVYPFSLTTRTTFAIGLSDVFSFYGTTGQATVTAQTVPEPASMFLLGAGLLGLAGSVRRRLKK